MKKILFYIFLASIGIVLIISFDFFRHEDHKFHVVFCDVGQGDGIFLITPTNAQILVDGGPDKSILSCLDRHMSFWDRSLDTIILTHPHADHLLGLVDVIDRYQLNGFYTEEVKSKSDIQKLLEAKLAAENLSAKHLLKGNNFKDKSGVKVKILWPRLEEIQKTDHNNTNLDLNGVSVVAKVTYGNFSVLLTGDAGANAMDAIANEVGDIDILKVPHHGSRTGMTDRFLEITKPEVAIISVGKNNYGHPSKHSLDQLESHKVKVFRTDKDGEVEIVTDGKAYQIKQNK